LQLISSGNNKSDNRVQEISEITRGLKLIAKELSVPVICLSQLNRGVEQREEKRPLLSDLRESGSIEQDADVVMFVYREVYYLEHEEPKQRATENEEKFNARIIKWEEDKILKKNLAEVIIAKQRHGPIGTIKMRFDGEFTRFDNLAADDENFNQN
jgi:replicative DNA helicase